MNFQKQFDTITGALNLFDLSYLVSGSAMLLVLSYVYPSLPHFLVHGDKLVFSVILCVVSAYIAGLISWVIGKRMRYLLMMVWNRKRNAVKLDFEALFEEAIKVCHIENDSKIQKMLSRSKSLTYSYMWMKLDQVEDEACKHRFDFISRFWTFRAIYEGLILPVIIFSVAFYSKCSIVCICCKDSCICKYLSCATIANIGWLILYIFVTGVVVAILALEARKCFKTQLREVVLAFGVFCEEDMKKL